MASPFASTALRGVAATLLLAAGSAKLAAVARDAPWVVLSGYPRSATIGLALGECWFAAWLLLNFYPRATRWLAIAVFATFATVSAHRVWAGSTSCGCFGEVEVDPRLLMVVDAALVALFAFIRPQPVSAKRSGPLLVFGVASFWGLVLAWGWLDPFSGRARAVEIDPRSLVGTRFFALDRIDGRRSLERGRWDVYLVRHTCRACREKLPHYREMARAARGRPDAPGVALIEVPPLDASSPPFLAAAEPALAGHLDPSVPWSLPTPTRLRLVDGVVVGGDGLDHGP